MQQQQLAAQLAHHGGQTRQPPLSPTPSDSDSDISLGAHSPPLSSPGGPTSRYGSPGPFRFGGCGGAPHSPGTLPPPPHFRFGSYVKSSPEETIPRAESPIRVDSPPPQQTTLTQPSPPPSMALNMRLGEQLTTPLRIQVASPGKLVEQQTSLHHLPTHGGIVRIAPPPGQQPLQLHRPFSPPRLT